MHLHPSGNTLVVTRRKIHLVLGRSLCQALSGLRVPDGRVCNSVDPFPSEPPVLGLDPVDFRKHLVRRPLHALVGVCRAAVQLQYSVHHAVIVHGPPAAGEGLVVAPVEGAVDLPALWDLKRLDHMGVLPVHVVLGVVVEVFKELSEEDVPGALQPRLTELWWKSLQLSDVVRLLLHQRLVIPHTGLNEAVLLRNLAGEVSPLNEKPLDPGMAHAAGVAGQVVPLGILVLDSGRHTTDAGCQDLELLLGELRGLVNVQDVALRALEVVQILVVGAVFEHDL